MWVVSRNATLVACLLVQYTMCTLGEKIAMANMDILYVVAHRLPHLFQHVLIPLWGCASNPVQMVDNGFLPEPSCFVFLLLGQCIDLFTNS